MTASAWSPPGGNDWRPQVWTSDDAGQSPGRRCPTRCSGGLFQDGVSLRRRGHGAGRDRRHRPPGPPCWCIDGHPLGGAPPATRSPTGGDQPFATSVAASAEADARRRRPPHGTLRWRPRRTSTARSGATSTARGGRQRQREPRRRPDHGHGRRSRAASSRSASRTSAWPPNGGSSDDKRARRPGVGLARRRDLGPHRGDERRDQRRQPRVPREPRRQSSHPPSPRIEAARRPSRPPPPAATAPALARPASPPSATASSPSASAYDKADADPIVVVSADGQHAQGRGPGARRRGRPASTPTCASPPTRPPSWWAQAGPNGAHDMAVAVRSPRRRVDQGRRTPVVRRRRQPAGLTAAPRARTASWWSAPTTAAATPTPALWMSEDGVEWTEVTTRACSAAAATSGPAPRPRCPRARLAGGRGRHRGR